MVTLLFQSLIDSLLDHSIFTYLYLLIRKIFFLKKKHSFSQDLIAGLAFAEFDKSKSVVQFHVDVDLESTEKGARVKAYAEVWGTDASGLDYVPVGESYNSFFLIF